MAPNNRERATLIALWSPLFLSTWSACGGKSEVVDSNDSTGTGGGDGDGVGGTGDTTGGMGNSSGGIGGSIDEPNLPMLGDSCAEPGAASCAENNQRLGLLCSGEGEWESDVTCSGSEICDWREESNTHGACVDLEPLCEGEEDGTSVCDEDELLTCQDGGIDTQRESCPLGCESGQCVPGDGCPSGAAVDCAGDCNEEGSECIGELGCATYRLDDPAMTTVVRVSRNVACSGSAGIGCDEHYIPISTTDKSATLKVSVGEGWRIVATEGIGTYWDNLCEMDQAVGCLIVPASSEYSHGVVVIPDDNAPPRNVQVEIVAPGTECP